VQALALSNEVDRLHAAIAAVEVSIGRLRATTAEAVRLKAQIWKRWADGGDLAADPILHGLISDLCGGEAA
jgi:hypothetical protein